MSMLVYSPMAGSSFIYIATAAHCPKVGKSADGLSNEPPTTAYGSKSPSKVTQGSSSEYYILLNEPVLTYYEATVALAL